MFIEFTMIVLVVAEMIKVIFATVQGAQLSLYTLGLDVEDLTVIFSKEAEMDVNFMRHLDPGHPKPEKL